jgi:branched-chain amino acid transport system substrate-binding protein
MPLSGAVGEYGKAHKAGLEAGVETVNRSGGINGRRVELEVVDDSGDPTQAVSLVQGKISEDKPDAVFPGATSGEALALCPILAQNNIVSLANASADEVNDQETCPLHFGPVVQQVDQLADQAEYMKTKGYASVGIVVANDAFGQSVAKNAARTFEAAGLQVVGTETFAPDALSMTSQLKRLQSKDPDVLYVDAPGAQSGYVLKSRHEMGWDVPVLGGTSTASTDLESLVGAEGLDGVEVHSYAIAVRGSGGRAGLADSRAAIDAFKQNTGGSLRQSLNLYSFTHDWPAIIQAAAREADSTDAEALREQLESWSRSPPADGNWVSFDTFAYAPDNHFNAEVEGAFAVADPATKDENGTLAAAR